MSATGSVRITDEPSVRRYASRSCCAVAALSFRWRLCLRLYALGIVGGILAIIAVLSSVVFVAFALGDAGASTGIALVIVGLC